MSAAWPARIACRCTQCQVDETHACMHPGCMQPGVTCVASCPSLSPPQVHLPQLAHFELDSAYQGLVTVAGLPALLAGAAQRLPNLASLSLNGLSLVPLSSSGGGAPGMWRSLPSSSSARRSPTGCAVGLSLSPSWSIWNDDTGYQLACCKPLHVSRRGMRLYWTACIGRMGEEEKC